jgi:hypothetical protein
MRLLLVFLLLANVRAQQSPCSCSCCNFQGCTPSPLPTVYVPYCTSDTCTAQCRAAYPQCQVTYPYGQISAVCGTTAVQLYSCRCDCCNTGSATCLPSTIGTSIAYTCQTASCSISCNDQYPSQCVSNQNGQTQGTCTGPITTTSSTTTVGPWLGNTCSCSCCQTGSSCLPTYVGITSASLCSSTACTQACQIRYPSFCPSLYQIGQTSGTCSSTTTGNTRCACRCLGATGYLDYNIVTNGGCITCDSVCRSQLPCISTTQVTYTCSTSNAKTSHPWIILILTITFSNFFVIN